MMCVPCELTCTLAIVTLLFDYIMEARLLGLLHKTWIAFGTVSRL